MVIKDGRNGESDCLVAGRGHPHLEPARAHNEPNI